MTVEDPRALMEPDRVDIAAARIPAMIKPAAPLGMRSIMNFENTSFGGCLPFVKNEQKHADARKRRNWKTMMIACNHRDLRLAEIVCRQHTLNDDMIDAVGGH